MFGGDASGLGGTNNLDVTWLWDGDDWTRANPAQSPSPRFEPASTALITDRFWIANLSGFSRKQALTWCPH